MAEAGNPLSKALNALLSMPVASPAAGTGEGSSPTLETPLKEGVALIFAEHGNRTVASAADFDFAERVLTLLAGGSPTGGAAPDVIEAEALVKAAWSRHHPECRFNVGPRTMTCHPECHAAANGGAPGVPLSTEREPLDDTTARQYVDGLVDLRERWVQTVDNGRGKEVQEAAYADFYNRREMIVGRLAEAMDTARRLRELEARVRHAEWIAGESDPVQGSTDPAPGCPHLHMEERFCSAPMTAVNPLPPIESYWWCHDCGTIVDRSPPTVDGELQGLLGVADQVEAHGLAGSASNIRRRVERVRAALSSPVGEASTAGETTRDREEGVQARPQEEWHEDDGPALWWAFPVWEPPYAGTPDDSGWPGYHTHWTPIVVPAEPSPVPGDTEHAE